MGERCVPRTARHSGSVPDNRRPNRSRGRPGRRFTLGTGRVRSGCGGRGQLGLCGTHGNDRILTAMFSYRHRHGKRTPARPRPAHLAAGLGQMWHRPRMRGAHPLLAPPPHTHTPGAASRDWRHAPFLPAPSGNHRPFHWSREPAAPRDWLRRRCGLAAVWAGRPGVRREVREGTAATAATSGSVVEPPQRAMA